jgi:E3 ubiquitin-protein ligase HERC4
MASEAYESTVLCWGSTSHGQLGLGGIEEDHITLPREVTTLRNKKIVNVCCGPRHTLFLMEGGTVYSCGNNDHSQLGHDKARRRPGKCFKQLFYY